MKKNSSNNEITLSFCGVVVTLSFALADNFSRWYRELQRYSVQVDFGNKYQYTREVGKGSFGVVNFGFELHSLASVAIKTIKKITISKSQTTRRDFLEELRVWRSLESPRIVRLRGVYETLDDIRLVMDQVKGGDMWRRINRRGAFSESMALSIFSELVEGLQYLHSVEVIHRDIKPENLFFENENSVQGLKIADFGLSTKASPGHKLHKICGTPGFAAPEMLRNEGYTQKADIYSAGCVLYILLTGYRPFEAPTLREILDRNSNNDVIYSTSWCYFFLKYFYIVQWLY